MCKKDTICSSNKHATPYPGDIENMIHKFAAIAALSAVLMSPLTNALSIVDTSVARGTITRINTTENSLEIVGSNGKKQVLQFSSDANIYLDGDLTALSSLSTGHSVQIKHKTYTPVATAIEGEIVQLNHRQKSAHIRVDENEVVEVKFGDNLAIGGAVSSFSDLRRGHQVVVRYAK